LKRLGGVPYSPTSCYVMDLKIEPWSDFKSSETVSLLLNKGRGRGKKGSSRR